MHDDSEHPGTSYADDLGMPEGHSELPSMQYEIGDRVRIEQPNGDNHGTEGRIVGREVDQYDVEVFGQNGSRLRVWSGFLQPLVPDGDQWTVSRVASEWETPRDWEVQSGEPKFNEGDTVLTKLGPARVQRVGPSPLGNVYRVELISGTQDFDVWEQDISASPQGAHLMMATFQEEPHVAAWKYILEHRGGTFAADTLMPVEADTGYGVGMRLEGTPDTEQTFPADEFQPDTVLAYWKRFGPLAASLDYKIGSWLYLGHYSMDVSQWYADRIEAILACIDHLQIAAFTCDTGEELFVLSPDRTTVLPEIVAELQSVSLDPESVQARLVQAQTKWASHLGG